MKCLHPISVRNPKKNFQFGQDPFWLTVPCGKCFACQSNKRSFWTCRLYFEAISAISSIFVTLTYDDEHLPLKNGFPTLNKRDCQLFLKRLRKQFPNHHIKYFLCGEYGITTARPHYHAIIFDLPLCGNFLEYYRIELLKIWSLGHITADKVNINRIGYVSKYILKTQSEKEHYLEFEIQPPFLLSSRRPAIGAAIADKIKDYLSPDNTTIHYHGYTFILPRYVKEKLPDYLQNAIDDLRHDYVKNLENNYRYTFMLASDFERKKMKQAEQATDRQYERKLKQAKHQLL